MKRALGHTLGTPGLSLEEALVLFHRSGLDGAEILWLDGYPSAIPESDDGSAVELVKRVTERLGLFVGCLTPYPSDYNSLDLELRQRDLQRMKRCIQTAAELGCGRIRVYGGSYSTEEHRQHRSEMWASLVDALGELGTLAAQHGVVLCVENHFSTMTESAAETVALMEAVALDSVGILYDQANLTFTHQEDAAEAIELQRPWIKHVHVKDLEFIDPHRRLSTSSVSHIQDEDRVHYSRMIGDGVLDWSDIVRRLDAIGYDGAYSLEYEYRWNPDDLPAPEIGFPESARRLRQAFAGD